MPKIAADVTNMTSPKDPPGGIATNGSAAVILTAGHSAKVFAKDER